MALEITEFKGFAKEGLDFLKKLQKNNKREWFQPRKEFFEEQLQRPMAALMFGLERALGEKKIPLRTNPKAVLFRIYRDVRFSADKTPYNTHVSGALYCNGKKDAPGGIYVHIGVKNGYMAAGFWQPERPLLTNWRLRMQEDPAGFQRVVKELKKGKLTISDEHKLKRMPRGFEALEGTPMADYVRLTSFVVFEEFPLEEALKPTLLKKIGAFASAAKPLLDYGWAVPRPKPTIFSE